MLRPTDAVPLRIYPVNRYVNDVRRDGPELIEPLSPTADRDRCRRPPKARWVCSAA